jgi:hypothetical protein
MIYELVLGDDRAYVLELLGKVGAAEPRAIAAYRAGLTDDDDDVVEHALDAVRAIATHAEAAALTDAVTAVASDHADAERRYQALGVLDHLDARRAPSATRRQRATAEESSAATVDPRPRVMRSSQEQS